MQLDTREGATVCFNLGRNWKEGEILRKVEKDEALPDGRTLHASPDDPAFIVREKESGKELHRKLSHLWSCGPVQAPMEGSSQQQQFRVGDKVQFQVANQYISGTIVGIVHTDTPFKNRTIHATKEDPQYIVRSEATGNETHHRGPALVKISGGEEEGPSEMPPGSKKRGQVEEFQKGQKAMFKVGRQWVLGEIVDKVTEEKQLQGRTIHATQEEPQFILKTDQGHLVHFHAIHLHPYSG